MTGLELEATTLIPNRALKQAVEAWRQRVTGSGGGGGSKG